MTFYCGMDISARDCHVCVIAEDLFCLLQQKVRNDLPALLRLIEAFKGSLRVVVERTCNWYWLVDGLQEAGYDVCLAPPLGLFMITGANVNTDRRDALALAKLLKAGRIPKAHIYPQESRPIRDLLRQRSRLVARRGTEYGRLRRLLLRHGLLEHSRNDIQQTAHEDLQRWFAHPVVRLHGQPELERIALFSQQLDTLVSHLLATVQDRPELHRLPTIPGVGTILAMTIFSEIGQIERFEDAREFSSYGRLVPGVAQSDPVSRRGRHAKQGSPHLKWAFSQDALYAMRSYPKSRRGFDRHLGRHRGKGGKLIAYGIMAHKLAQAVYHVLRDGTALEDASEIDNGKRSTRQACNGTTHALRGSGRDFSY
jgi:transposase